MTARSLTPEDYARARRLLLRRDPVLADAIRRIGACGLPARQHTDHLTALTRAIVGQQLSGKAASAIFERFRALFPDGVITASAISSFDDQALRSVGLSGQKVGYLRDLSARIGDGRLQLDALEFGRWTAEMFLMFRLHRPDVLPVADLGIMKAIQSLYGLRKRPNAKKILAIGEPWRPYRSIASWYLWQSLSAKVVVKSAPSSSATGAGSRARSRRVSRAR